MSTTTRRTLLAVAVAAAIGLGGPAACASPATSPTPTQTAEQSGTPAVATAWAQAWNSADPQQLAALYTDDARYTDHAFGPTFTGRSGVVTWATMTFEGVGGLTADVVGAFRSGDQVSVRWTFGGQLMGAPAPFSVPVATVLQLRGEQIVATDDFYNLAEVLRQSGLPADTSFTQP